MAALPLRALFLRGAFAIALTLGVASASAAEVKIALSAASGLKFEPARFVVEPGAKVTVTFNNPDDMMHNLVVVRPGARLAVVEAALALGEQGPARNFVPESDRVIAAMPVVTPGGKGQLSFTAPTEEGVYPYVCTFPGHGYVMFGAMYVGRAPQLPPLAEDPHVPPPVVAASTEALSRTTLVRTFLPDCGPAAIAVGLPGGLAYAFDAGQCRLRYAWRDGFIDNSSQLLGKGDQFAIVQGRVFYRATAGARLRVGDVTRPVATQWKGTRIVAGNPQLLYRIDGADIVETPGTTANGKTLAITYEVTGATGPVSFAADPEGGAKITSTAGTWTGPLLTLTPEEARRFTLTFTEREGVEPLAYWSMNDLPFSGRKDPLPGVVGRAFTPGGNLGRWEVLDTGIKLGAVLHSGTLMSWVKLDPAPAQGTSRAAPTAPVFSADEGGRAFIVAAPQTLSRWQHIAAVLRHGTLTLYVDGKETASRPVPPTDPEVTIRLGSLGKKVFLSGLLDEVRIYDRALSADEIAAIQQREKSQAPAKIAVR